MTARNPYAVLGVPPNATAEGIKSAYKERVRATHPDLNEADPQKTERLREIIAAYELLKDPEKRAAHDRARAAPAGVRQRRPRPPPPPPRQPSPPPRTHAPPPPPWPPLTQAVPFDVGALVVFALGFAGAAGWAAKVNRDKTQFLARARRGQWDPVVQRRRGPDGRFVRS